MNHLRRYRLALVLGFVALCTLAWPTRAEAQRGPQLGSVGSDARQVINKTPKALEGIGIEDRAGVALPLDVRLTSNAGKEVHISDYVDGERPLLVVLAYYNCPMLCSLVVNGLVDGLKPIAWTAGDQFRILVISFDPRDHLDVAQEKQKNYVGAYGREVKTPKEGGPGGFEFTVGEEAEVRRLADAVGFHYQWDAANNQYAHAAGVFVVTPQGKLATTLTGVRFEAEELQKELISADKEITHSPLSAVLMRCYVYDAKAGKYVLNAILLMKAGGVLSVLALAGLLFRVTRKQKPQQPEADGPSEAA